MTDLPSDIGKYIAGAKRGLQKQASAERAFNNARDSLLSSVEQIVDLRAKGAAVVPEVSYTAIENGAVSNADISAIKQRGGTRI